jgi:alpha,alpha-trehalose phosphorylase
MRDHEGKLTFAPRLPARLTRLRFRLVFRGRRLHVDVTKRDATYTLREGDPLRIAHHGRPLDLSAGKPVTEAIPPFTERPRPSQPPGREPLRRAPNGS